MSNKSERNQEATVWIGGLDDEVNESLLWELMIQAGPVKSVNIPRDKITGDHSGYAFCEFSSEEDADYAMKIMNMVRLYGKSLKINKASRDRKDTGVGANVFVGNLDPEVDDQLLYNTFSAFGQVLSAKVMYDDDGTSRGFGFVNFADFESSDAAILHMSGQFLCNKSVHVSYAYKKEGTKGEKHGSENERLIAKLQAKTAKRPHMHFSAAPNLLNGSNNDRNNNNSTSSNNDRNNNNSNNISSNKSNIPKQKPILPVNIQSRTNLPPPPPIPNQSLKLNSNPMQLQQLVMAAAMSQQLHLQSHSMNQIPKPKPPPPPPMPPQQSTTIINNQSQTNNNSQLNPNNNLSSNQSKIPEPISKKPPITTSNNPLIKRLPPPPPHQSLLPQQTWMNQMNQMNPQLLQQQQRMLMNQRLIQQQQWNQVNQQQSNHLKIPSKQPPPPPPTK